MSEAPSAEAEALRERSWLGVASAAAILLIALATAIGSLSLGYWTPIGPGAGFFPLVIAVVLGLAAIFWGLTQWRGTAPSEVTEGEQPASLGRIITTVASLAILSAVLEILGFQLSVLLFLFFHLRILGKQKWIVTIPITLAGSFGLYLLFSKVLSVGLPASSIPLLNELGF